MRLLKADLMNNKVTVNITSLEDFWYLSHIIDKNDIVTARTFRKINLSGSDERTQNIIKKSITLDIEVEKTDVTENSIRVSGKILNDIEDIRKGSYHTITLELNSTATINKPKWLRFQLDKIKESSLRQEGILIVALDRDNASFALLKKYGFEHLLDINGDVEKKFMKENIKNNFYSDVITKMKEYVERYEIKRIILASPAFWKDELMKEIKDKNLLGKIITATCHDTGKEGITEIINRDEVKTILKEERIFQETKLVEELLAEIAKENLAAYGIKQVKHVAECGAVKDLLLCNAAIQKFREENKYDELDEIMSLVEKSSGNVHIISSEHDSGKRLNGLGGIAAILRYKVY